MDAKNTNEGAVNNSSASNEQIESKSIKSRGISDVRASMLNYEGGRETTEIAVHSLTRGYIPLDVSWKSADGDVGILANLTAEEAEAVGEKLIEAAEELRSSPHGGDK